MGRITDRTPPLVTPPGLERPPCPRCGGAEQRLVCAGLDFLYDTGRSGTAVECTGCGLWFQSPRPPRERHGELYPAHYSPHGEPDPARRLSPAILSYLTRRRGYRHLAQERRGNRVALGLLDAYAAWRVGVALIPAYVEGGAVLDIGCGGGTMLRTLGSLGWSDLHGIEPDPEAAARASVGGAKVRSGAVEDVLDQYPDASFDAIIASMVVEHLSDPFGVIREVARKLRPGGELLLSTIRRGSLDQIAFGKYWAGFDFPRHMVYFRNEDILAMLSKDFERPEVFAQAAPIDWVRSASWRRGAVDGLAVRAGRRGWLIPSVALAVVGRSTRVSLRCRRTRTLWDAPAS